MNEIINAMLKRRSYRKFKQEQIKNEELEQIIEAGLWAPSAGGRQSPVMLVCQNAEVNNLMGKINRMAFGAANSDGIHFVSKNQMSIADDDTIKSGFYNAPTVITLFAPERWLYGIHDCSTAAENMMLAAWSLGIGSCFISRSEETFDTEEGKLLKKEYDIPEYYKARVSVVFGYPDGTISDAKVRHDNRVKWIHEDD